MTIDEKIKAIKLSISAKEHVLKSTEKDNVRDILSLDIKALKNYLAYLEIDQQKKCVVK